MAGGWKSWVETLIIRVFTFGPIYPAKNTHTKSGLGQKERNAKAFELELAQAVACRCCETQWFPKPTRNPAPMVGSPDSADPLARRGLAVHSSNWDIWAPG